MRTLALSMIITCCFITTACHMSSRPGENLFQTQSGDASITTAVLESMLNDENTSTLKVHVETIHGVVSLNGYVKTIRQSDMCEDVARKTPGVISVQNNIIVRK